MFVDAFLAFCFWSFMAVVGGIALVQRRRAKGRRSRFGFYPSAALLGNAFQQLQIITQPKVQYVIEETMDEEAEEDESGGPDTARAARRHLLRQAERIRRGEELERLTTLLDCADDRENKQQQKQEQKQIPFGNDNQKSNSKSQRGNREDRPPVDV